MRKLIYTITGLLLVIDCYSQITFEKGYYIDNTNRKTECLIKNNDWESNPTTFVYKISNNSEPETVSIDQVKEFEIINKFKFKRFVVKIDQSSESISELDNNRHPVFVEKVLFLKVLVEGKANLYSYSNKGPSKYFFNVDSANIEQLVYKSYKTSKNQVAKNNLYQLQLLENLKCKDISYENIQNTEYESNDLEELFILYNRCHNSEPITFEEKQKRDLFNLTIRPGVKYSSLYIQNKEIYFKDVDFGGRMGVRLGLEAELIMPFKNNKWSVFIEPAYQNFLSTCTKISKVTTGEEITANIDYHSIELVLGLKYYLYLNTKSKLFMNPSLLYDFSSASFLEIIRDDGAKLLNLEVSSNTIKTAIGLGYNYNDRYNVELRYQSRDILGNYLVWRSNYNTVSVIFGYTIF